MDTKDLITLIGIGITLIVGVANLINSLVTNKRTLYVNAVTSERVKWIGQLKDLLAEYSSLTYFYKQKKILQGAELNAYIEKLSYLRHRIKLHLNPVGEKDKKIVSLIDKINKKYILIYDFYKFTRGEIKTEAEYIKRIDRMVSLLDKEHLQELQEELDWFEKARKNDEEFDEESDEEFDEESDEEFDEESDEEFDEESDEESDEEFDEESDEEFDEESDEESDEEFDE
ncbi:hypothetical protein, partial [Exiguobacterium sp. s142]|uniref:hypothetical protein n=1 Tax=Exiguobacterium sp. s142 TaxID=2751222 RepID=UPI001BE8D792